MTHMKGPAFRRGISALAKGVLMGCAGLAAIGAGGAAAQRRGDGEAELAKMLKDRTPGKAVNCINLSRAQSSRIVDKTAIVYEVGGTLYVNRPRSGAETLDDDDILVTRSFTGSLCRLDTVRLIDRTTRFPHGFVALGDFVPYKRPRSVRR